MKLFKFFIATIFLLFIVVVGSLYFGGYNIRDFSKDNIIENEDYYFKYTNIYTELDAISSVSAYKKTGIFTKDVTHENYQFLVCDNEIIGCLFVYKGESNYYNFIIGEPTISDNNLVFYFDELLIEDKLVEVYKQSYFVSDNLLSSFILDDNLVTVVQNSSNN